MESDGVGAERAAQNQAGNRGEPGAGRGEGGLEAPRQPPRRGCCHRHMEVSLFHKGPSGSGGHSGSRAATWSWSLALLESQRLQSRSTGGSRRRPLTESTASPLTRSLQGLPGPRSAGARLERMKSCPVSVPGPGPGVLSDRVLGRQRSRWHVGSASSTAQTAPAPAGPPPGATRRAGGS